MAAVSVQWVLFGCIPSTVVCVVSVVVVSVSRVCIGIWKIALV